MIDIEERRGAFEEFPVTTHCRTTRHLRLPALAVLPVAITALLTACSPTSDEKAAHTPAASPPNILLILADDLGYGDLGSFGSRTIATPHLDRLAEDGLRFTSFYANGPICTPTRTSLLTGRYAQRFGLYEGVSGNSEWGLPADIVTLPGLLKGAGYRTMHIGKWHLGHAQEVFRPLAKGFDNFFGFLHAHQLPKTYHNPRLRRDSDHDSLHSGYLTDLLTREAEAFLRRQRDSDPPFFLNLWYFNPHKPLQPPMRWAKRYDDSVPGRYAAQVSALDENIGQLLAVLDETGFARETIVLFLSDNGGATDIHGGRNGPLRGGKNQLYEGGIRVPLIVRWPGTVAPGTVSDALVAGFDLFATAVEVAKVEVTDTDGRSLKSVLEGEAANFDGPLFWEDIHQGRQRYAVRRGPWKLLSIDGHAALYDLREDIGESSDLSSKHRDVVVELTAAFEAWHAQLPPPHDL